MGIANSSLTVILIFMYWILLKIYPMIPKRYTELNWFLPLWSEGP